VLSLFSAISSGNVTDAQSAYDSLTSLLNSTDSSSTSTSSTSDSASSSTATSFKNLLAQIGSALSSGNVTNAQDALDGFLQSLSTGSLVSATA
jgi:E3 ubiquitin-protein ligase DOA10